MTIRAYNKTKEDFNGMMALLEELRGSSDASRFSIYLMDSNFYKNNYLDGKNYIVLVAIEDDAIVGFMIAEHYTNEIANLITLYVSQKHRKKGIAFILKTTMENLCRDRGYKKIVSQVRMNNYESISLNLKAGWKQEIDKVYSDYYYWFTKEL